MGQGSKGGRERNVRIEELCQQRVIEQDYLLKLLILSIQVNSLKALVVHNCLARSPH